MPAVPQISELPRPPAGLTGWPWTEGSPPPADTLPDGRPWPTISVVTPSYNQGRFLEETLRSVLLQGYPDLEYIVMDGGSTDDSAAIIEKYAPWLTTWTSEPDAGQGDALCRGFEQAAGTVFGWLNSDDVYRPGALRVLAELRAQHEDCVAWIGAVEETDEKGHPSGIVMPRSRSREEMACWLVDKTGFHQPGCLFDAGAYREAGGIDARFHYFLDVDLWLRLAKLGRFATTDRVVATARIYPQAKSHAAADRMAVEHVASVFDKGFTEAAQWKLERYVGERLRSAGRDAILATRNADQVLAWLTWRDMVRNLVKRARDKMQR